MPVAPRLQVRALYPSVERAERGSAVNLIVQLLFFIAVQRKPVRVNKVPAKDQGHLLFRRTLQLFDAFAAGVAIIGLGFLPDIVERALEILLLNLSSCLGVDFVN